MQPLPPPPPERTQFPLPSTISIPKVMYWGIYLEMQEKKKKNQRRYFRVKKQGRLNYSEDCLYYYTFPTILCIGSLVSLEILVNIQSMEYSTHTNYLRLALLLEQPYNFKNGFSMRSGNPSLTFFFFNEMAWNLINLELT